MIIKSKVLKAKTTNSFLSTHTSTTKYTCSFIPSMYPHIFPILPHSHISTHNQNLNQNHEPNQNNIKIRVWFQSWFWTKQNACCLPSSLFPVLRLSLTSSHFKPIKLINQAPIDLPLKLQAFHMYSIFYDHLSLAVDLCLSSLNDRMSCSSWFHKLHIHLIKLETWPYHCKKSRVLF